MQLQNDSEKGKNPVTVREIQAKSILSTSKIYSYVINPYVGCQHACSYCYARYMKKFTGHSEPWGRFVDVKVNAAQLLQKEINRKKKATVWISGVWGRISGSGFQDAKLGERRGVSSHDSSYFASTG